MTHERSAIAAERDDPLDEPGIHLPDAREDGKEDQHRHENERERHLGRESDAEPDHEQRREDHARDGVEHGHHRLEQLRDEANAGRNDAEENAHGNAERETAERGSERCLEMRPDSTVREQLDERGCDPARTRRIHRIEQVGAAGRLPHREQDRECGKLARPRVAGIANHHAASAR